ncbi:MAG TPA: EAL domain-containing protein [Geminicoccaceae bacterium]|nr:EAL domain-containing protein [Geminicoccaceae bacterium]
MAGVRHDSIHAAERRRQAALEALPGLVARLPTLAAINLSVAALLAVMFAPVIAAPTLAGWLGLMAALQVLRLLLWRRYRRAPPTSRLGRGWLRLLVGGTAATGALWGLAGALFYVPASVAHEVFLSFTIGGMVAGAAISLTAHLPTFFAFYLPALLPYAARLALELDPPHLGMAALVVGFGLGIGALGVGVHRSLRASEARYRAVVEDQTEFICRFRPDGTLTFVNGAYGRYFGTSPERLVGTNWLELLPPEEREPVRRRFAALMPESATATYEHPVIRSGGGGEIRWQQWRDRAIFDPAGRLVEYQSVGRDITERREAEEAVRRARDELERRVEERTAELGAANRALLAEVAERQRVEAALRESERRFRDFAAAASDWFWETDAGHRFTWVSANAEALVGVPREGHYGTAHLELMAPGTDPAVVEAHRRTLDAHEPFRDFEYLRRGPGGDAWLSVSGVPVIDAGGRFQGYRGISRDITEKKRAEERIRELAHHDDLTGLPNRRLLDDRLQQAVARARRSGEGVALLLLDLDHFKDINDTLGHPLGDRLLRAIAVRLGQGLRASDTLARLGGDEFAVIQAGLRGPESAAALAGKLIDAAAAPVRVDDHEVVTGASIGISLFPGDGAEVPLLLRNADLALYRAKAAGRGRYRFFRPSMAAAAEARRRLEGELRRALERREFLLHYQPLLDAAQGRITGVEALVRWRHPRRGVLPPALFIPSAETTGLIQPLGEWVLREACRQAGAWHGARRPLTVAVNLSPVQVRQPDAVARLARIIDQAGVAPGAIEFEITEGVFVDAAATSAAAGLDRLVGAGARIAIDDFGTGYCSLAYLQRFPVHTIKIDRSFVGHIGRDGEAIVEAVLALGRSLNKRVVAEGVETMPQLAFLRGRGCPAMQGFLIGRPQGPEELGAFLATWPVTWSRLSRANGAPASEAAARASAAAPP